MESNALLNARVALITVLLLVGMSLAFPPRKGDVLEVDIETANQKVIGNTVVLAPFWAPEKGDVWLSLLPSPTRFADITGIAVQPKEVAVGFWFTWELTLILIIAALTGWVAKQKRVEIKVSIVVAAILIFLSLVLAPKTRTQLVGQPMRSEPYFTVGPVWEGYSHFDVLVIEWCLIVVIATLVGLRSDTSANEPLPPLLSTIDDSLAKRGTRKADSLPIASAKQTPESDISADIKERVSNLADEEILRMLTTYFPDYRKEWVDISIEELKERGFVLEPTDAELKVVTPDGQKLSYPKIQSGVGPIGGRARIK